MRESYGLRLDLTEEMLIDSERAMFGFWWHWSD